MGTSEAVRLSDIYNLLFAGKRLQLEFPTSAEAERFRIRLSQFKLLQDRVQLNLGMMTEDERQKLVFRYEEEKQLATMKLEDRPDPRQYTIKILDDEDESDEEEA